jgi:excisionase family DNA binding protein
MDGTLWNARQAADYMCISRSTLYDWIARGMVPHVVLGSGTRRRCIRFRPDDIQRFIESRTSPASQ